MKRSVMSFVLVKRQYAPCARPVSNCPGFLLRHGHHYHRPAWTQLHRRWLAGLKFELAVHYIVLEDCIAAIEAATARRDRLEGHIEAASPAWSLAPVVQALRALRGVGLVAAATLVAELGDITRFTNPRQLMAYLGLVPSEHSSGRTRRQAELPRPAMERRDGCRSRRPGVIAFPRGSAESNCCGRSGWLSRSETSHGRLRSGSADGIARSPERESRR
jgi:hypothetical protein